MQAFVRNHYLAPLSVGEIEDMMAHLISGPECVLDFRPHSVFVVVDRCENARGSAELHLVAWDREQGPVDQFLETAATRARAVVRAQNKTYLDFTPPDVLNRAPAEFLPAYSMLRMSLAIPDEIPRANLPPGYAFREYTENDIKEYYEAVRLVFKESPETSIPQFAEFEARGKALKVNPELLLHDHRIAGFTRIAESLEEIATVGVTPEHRGKKLGEQLVLQALRVLQAKGRRRTFLSVLSTNLPALAVYRKIGFRQTEERITYSRALN